MLHSIDPEISRRKSRALVDFGEMSAKVGLCALISLIVLTANPQRVLAQDSSDVKIGRVALIGGVTLGTVIPVHLYQQSAWWQGQRAPFRFENDWKYALNVDKVGHMYAGYILSRTFGYMLRWSGLSEHSSTFYGSVFGLSYQMYVEVEDGFHRDYGFSPGDAFSNMVGATIPLAQSTFPVLKNFAFKYSYWPSSKYLDELHAGQARAFLDDYQGTTVWLAVDPHFFIGNGAARVVPPWLGLAIGMAARDLDLNGNGRRIYSLALDYNLSKIDTDSDLLQAIFTLIDYIHLPAPGIQFEGNHIRVGVFYP